MKYILIFTFFMLFISCKENTQLTNIKNINQPENIENSNIESNIKKAYPGCKIYQYNDNDLVSNRYLTITADSIIIIIDALNKDVYPFDQTIFITRL